MPPNFVEKPFADGTQTSKSVKVFFLESFPLYGTLCMSFWCSFRVEGLESIVVSDRDGVTLVEGKYYQ